MFLFLDIEILKYFQDWNLWAFLFQHFIRKETIIFINHDECELPAMVFDAAMFKWFLAEVMVLLRSHLKFPVKNLRSTWKAFEKVFLTFFKNYFSILQSEKIVEWSFPSLIDRERKNFVHSRKNCLRIHRSRSSSKKVMMENGKNMCGWHSDVYTPP